VTGPPAEDVLAIERLVALYGHAADGAARLDDVFTEDAVLDMSALSGEVYRGLARIRAFFALGAPPHPPSHHTTNVVVAVEGDAARVLSKWMTVDRATGGLKTGDYADVVVRLAGGWRIRERVATPRWYPAEPVRMGPGPGAAGPPTGRR
jgi:ketosteroid isomerase-like protein